MQKKPRTDAEVQLRKQEIMEQCFDCYAENGFNGTGIKMLAKHCGCTSANLYVYFENLDDLIIQSTEHCMSKVEDDFMEKAPANVEELMRFIDEIPYWTKEKHGKKYRLMYQIYTHPKYIEYGKKFFAGVNRRYIAYAKSLEDKLHIPSQKLVAMIFLLIRACVHYALFEDEYYLRSQLDVLKEGVEMFIQKYAPAVALQMAKAKSEPKCAEFLTQER